MSDWLHQRVETLMRIADDSGYPIQMYSEYAEPGYTDPESGYIALSDWNRKSKWNKRKKEFVTTDDTMPRIAELLEKLGVEIHWHDEWHSCSNCNKLVRCNADCHGWQPAYANYDDVTLCLECVDPKDHLRHCVEKGNGNSIESIHPEDHGYVLIQDELENGWYGGQRASPDLIMKAMDEAGVRGVLMNLDSVGQFDMSFSVYVLKKLGKKNIAKAKEVMNMPSKINLKEDPAETLKRGLKAASEATAKLPDGPGVKYAKINPDGTVDARVVGPQEFIDGIKD